MNDFGKENCISCEQGYVETCPNSKRSCGHHCNCSWTQDKCCWCGAEFGEYEPPSETGNKLQPVG